MTIRPPMKTSSARRSCAAASARVEVVSLGVEELDRLRDDPRAGRDDQLVVGEREAVGQCHELPGFVDPLNFSDDERHPLVEQRPLRALEVGRALATHGDVHEPGLVDVLAMGIDHDDLRLATVDPGSQLPGQEIGGEGAPDAPTENEDPLHGAPTDTSRR